VECHRAGYGAGEWEALRRAHVCNCVAVSKPNSRPLELRLANSCVQFRSVPSTSAIPISETRELPSKHLIGLTQGRHQTKCNVADIKSSVWCKYTAVVSRSTNVFHACGI